MECMLISMWEALGLIPITTKNKISVLIFILFLGCHDLLCLTPEKFCYLQKFFLLKTPRDTPDRGIRGRS